MKKIVLMLIMFFVVSLVSCKLFEPDWEYEYRDHRYELAILKEAKLPNDYIEKVHEYKNLIEYRNKISSEIEYPPKGSGLINMENADKNRTDLFREYKKTIDRISILELELYDLDALHKEKVLKVIKYLRRKKIIEND